MMETPVGLYVSFVTVAVINSLGNRSLVSGRWSATISRKLPN